MLSILGVWSQRASGGTTTIGAVAAFVGKAHRFHKSLPSLSFGIGRYPWQRSFAKYSDGLKRRTTTCCPAKNEGQDDNVEKRPIHSVVDTNHARSNLLEQEIQNSLCQEVWLLFNDKRAPTASKQQPQKLFLVVGVSGGCDSVGLLHGLLQVLLKLKDGLGLPCCDENNDETATIIPCAVHVAHFDHQLRGAESDGDRLFVEQLCQSYGIPCHVYFWNQDHAPNTTFSQDTARTWRRQRQSELLRQVSHSHSNGFIVTAHHADDSMESLLLKLLRGTHITNIKGMDQSSHDEDGNRILRPLLGVTKTEVVEYLLQRNLTWREDSSNTSDAYFRNKIRHDLVPLLSELVGGDHILRKRADNLSKQSADIRQDLQQRATRYLQETQSEQSSFAIPQPCFELVHKEALYEWVTRSSNGHQFTYEHLERVCQQLVDFPQNLEWTLNIGRGWDVVREGNMLYLVPQNGNDAQQESKDGSEPDVAVPWQKLPKEFVLQKDDTSKDMIEVYFGRHGVDTLCGFFSSTVRKHNLPFSPPWRQGRSPTKASQFLRGQRVPLHQRRETPIVYALGKDGSKMATALLLPTTGKWVIDSSFTKNDDDDCIERVLLSLPGC